MRLKLCEVDEQLKLNKQSLTRFGDTLLYKYLPGRLIDVYKLYSSNLYSVYTVS